MPTTEQTPAPMTVPAAARRLGLDPKTLRRAIRAGDVRVVRLGARVRVSAAEVERILTTRTT